MATTMMFGGGGGVKYICRNCVKNEKGPTEHMVGLLKEDNQ